MVDIRRIRKRNDDAYAGGAVLYWMQRDERVHDNWALLYAQEQALIHKVPLYVVFNFVPVYNSATAPLFLFLLQGLQVVEKKLQKFDIPFVMTEGNPEVTIPEFVKKHDVGLVVSDFNPLTLPERWKVGVAKNITCSFEEVDAHNIVPCWIASPKEEFAAHTFRPKIRALYREFATVFPSLKKHTHASTFQSNNAWEKILAPYQTTDTLSNYAWLTPGEDEAKKTLAKFLTQGLHGYDVKRNDPNEDAQSNLSPYLHFGHIGAQTIALSVEKSDATGDDKRAFLEELVVRKELSDNFCFYQKQYQSFDALRDWGKKTLDEHRKDVREFVYTKKEFEDAVTHDPLWNAAQMEMIKKGKMHGYMRMYWAKKILEWTKTPEDAIAIAVYLNDTYSLDGRDPNGYVGILWSIGGIHDRAWFERPVYGKIRYMNDNGCKRKFDVPAYIAYVAAL
jgi:deoxyribodipyrimidine photo-lyase